MDTLTVRGRAADKHTRQHISVVGPPYPLTTPHMQDRFSASSPRHSAVMYLIILKIVPSQIHYTYRLGGNNRPNKLIPRPKKPFAKFKLL